MYHGKTFVITIKIKDIKNLFLIEKEQIQLQLKAEEKEENKKAIVRGAFMGAGSINNPQKEYHLEITLSNKENRKAMMELLKSLEIQVKTLDLAIYLKDGEEISRFLALIGAAKAVMEFEDIRIQKEMRGRVNRLVNCETANLNKTINASIEQIAAIKKLQETGKLQKLDDNLKEIAILRLENPDMSLLELGKKLNEPLGKSGVNYRLKKIMEIAKEET